MIRGARIGACVMMALAVSAGTAAAQDWIETKSPNFVVISNADQGRTRTLVWQLEQVRSAIAALFPWARMDLDRPVAVIAVRDERGMKALAPEYWEQRGGIRPASVWVGAPDRYYLAIRADVEAEGQDTINPHITAYFAYASLILQRSLPATLPLWFVRGFAGVLSNTIVRDSQIRFVSRSHGTWSGFASGVV